MAPHSSTLAWKIPWMEEPGGLQSMGSLWGWHILIFFSLQIDHNSVVLCMVTNFELYLVF